MTATTDSAASDPVESLLSRARILGVGAYVPERVMTNKDWERYVDTTDEWIVTRTGIRERRFAAEGETTADMAVQAARRALEDADLTADDVDEIVVATDTPEVYTPDTASFVQHRLGTREIPGYDLGGSGCAGYVLALDIARTRAAMTGRRILVIGVELLSRLMNWEHRETCVLFGDAAGATVVGPGEGIASIEAVTAGTDGSRADILTLEAGGTRLPFSREVLEKGLHKNVVMHGREVFREAVRRMSAAAREVMAATGLSGDDLALVIPHQANLRIIHAVGAKLGVAREKVFVNLERYGNTGSATVPLALWEARNAGRMGLGTRCC